MAVTIRLSRQGAKKHPQYLIVAVDSAKKRDGAYLENLGTYNPTRNPAEINLKLNRVTYWIEKGAQPTNTVSRLIKASSKAAAASSTEA